jgi:transposase InsO family protein
LWSVHTRKRGLHRKPGPPVHDDLVLRDFTAEQPNQLWLTDIERHEALLNRAVVKGHRGRSVAAGRCS